LAAREAPYQPRRSPYLMTYVVLGGAPGIADFEPQPLQSER
jgi:hypothetical protein